MTINKRPKKVAPKNNVDAFIERVRDEAIEKGLVYVFEEGPKIVGKILSSFFPLEGGKKPNVASTKNAMDHKIITPDFSGLGGENWWEVLSVNINASEEEIHEAAEKLLAKKQSTKAVSEKALKEKKESRKRVLGACVMGLASIKEKNEP